MTKVAKVVELVGSSKNSWEEAAATAVKVASKTIKDISGVHVQDMTAAVKDGKITQYKATVKVAFGVKD